MPARELTQRNLRMIALYCEQFSLCEIAEKFGISRQRVNQIIKRSGIKMRPVGQRVKDITLKPRKPTNSERFWSMVNKLDDENACWFWKNQNGKKKYGVMSYKGKYWKSHHLAWFFTYGKRAENWVLHDCGNSFCCNPKHLKDGTPAENTRDRFRHAAEKGIITSPMKLNWEQVQLIRTSWATKAKKQADLARDYGVSQSTICNIVKNKIWVNSPHSEIC